MNYQFCLLDIWHLTRWIWPFISAFYAGCIFTKLMTCALSEEIEYAFIFLVSIVAHIFSILWLGGVIK